VPQAADERRRYVERFLVPAAVAPNSFDSHSLWEIRLVDPLRILFVWEWLVVGGAEHYLVRKARHLRARGHDVWVASAGGPLLGDLVATGVRHLTLPTLSQAVGAPTLRDAAADWARLYELIDEEAIDVVDTIAVKPFLYAAPICRRRGVPLVLEALSPCHLVPRDAREDVAPLFAEGGVVAMEEGMGHAYRAFGIDTSGVRVIPNMVDTDVFRPPAADERARARAALGVAERERLVLAVSRLDADKARGIERLIEEFRAVVAAHPDARLVIAGDGSESEVIRARARAHLGERGVRIAGTKDPSTVASWYQAADLFVGMGTAVLEAAACGVPAVVANGDFMVMGRMPARDAAAAGTFGSEGFTGIGSNLGPSPSSFEARIVALLADEEGRRGAAARGLSAVREAFATGVVMSRWESYYAERRARAPRAAYRSRTAFAAAVPSGDSTRST
jgi:glycosyltransferase involved in cell wall biosynthesis